MAWNRGERDTITSDELAAARRKVEEQQQEQDGDGKGDDGGKE